MIIALTDDSYIYTWNATTFTSITPPTNAVDASYNFHLDYDDFSCD